MTIDPKMQEKINRAKREFGTFNDKRWLHVNEVGFQSHPDPIHELKKAEVCHGYFMTGDYFLTNPTLNTGHVPDILIIPANGGGPYVVEIVNTEDKKSIERKRNEYPLEIRVVEV